MNTIRLDEEFIVERVKSFLLNKEKWNRHEEKMKISLLHWHWPDIRIAWWNNNGETFTVECKWKSYAKNSKTINKEVWIHALWQIITRIEKERIIQSWKYKWDINRADKYWLWLYRVSAQVALRRIPKNIAKTLNLYIFSCNDKWEIKQFSPKDFWQDRPDEKFI